MSELKTKLGVRVFAAYDRVVLRVQNIDILIPYAIAAKIAQGVRVGSRQIKRVCNEKEHWSVLADNQDLEVDDYFKHDPKPHVMQQFNWRVDVRGEDIVLIFNELRLQMHFTDALQISQWLRKAVKYVKDEIGDHSKAWNAMGVLTDAEQNYKIG